LMGKRKNSRPSAGPPVPGHPGGKRLSRPVPPFPFSVNPESAYELPRDQRCRSSPWVPLRRPGPPPIEKEARGFFHGSSRRGRQTARPPSRPSCPARGECPARLAGRRFTASAAFDGLARRPGAFRRAPVGEGLVSAPFSRSSVSLPLVERTLGGGCWALLFPLPSAAAKPWKRPPTALAASSAGGPRRRLVLTTCHGGWHDASGEDQVPFAPLLRYAGTSMNPAADGPPCGLHLLCSGRSRALCAPATNYLRGRQLGPEGAPRT